MIEECRRFIASAISQIWQGIKKALEVRKCCRVITHPNGAGVVVECKHCAACKKLDNAILEAMLTYNAH